MNVSTALATFACKRTPLTVYLYYEFESIILDITFCVGNFIPGNFKTTCNHFQILVLIYFWSTRKWLWAQLRKTICFIYFYHQLSFREQADKGSTINDLGVGAGGKIKYEFIFSAAMPIFSWRRPLEIDFLLRKAFWNIFFQGCAPSKNFFPRFPVHYH